MKINLGILALFIISACESKYDSSLRKNSIKGNVEIIIDSLFYASEEFGDIVKESFVEKEINYYNQKGNLAKSLFYNSLGFKHTEIVYEYDRNDYCIVKTVFLNDKIKNTILYEYDEQGNATQIDILDGDRNLKNRQKIKYAEDSQDRPIEEYIYHSDGKLDYKILYNYFDSLETIEETYFEDNQLEYKRLITKKNGLITHDSWFNSEIVLQKKISYTYENKDKMGNWTRRVEYINEVPSKLLERTFNYY